jgi:hypothetical protein
MKEVLIDELGFWGNHAYRFCRIIIIRSKEIA